MNSGLEARYVSKFGNEFGRGTREQPVLTDVPIELNVRILIDANRSDKQKLAVAGHWSWWRVLAARIGVPVP